MHAAGACVGLVVGAVFELNVRVPLRGLDPRPGSGPKSGIPSWPARLKEPSQTAAGGFGGVRRGPIGRRCRGIVSGWGGCVRKHREPGLRVVVPALTDRRSCARCAGRRCGGGITAALGRRGQSTAEHDHSHHQNVNPTITIGGFCNVLDTSDRASEYPDALRFFLGQAILAKSHSGASPWGSLSELAQLAKGSAFRWGGKYQSPKVIQSNVDPIEVHGTGILPGMDRMDCAVREDASK